MESSFFAFLIAITLLTITPGMDTVLVIRNTTRGGFKDGMVTNLGICSGLFLHATFTAVGISVILLHSAMAFTTLKVVGACYLVYLGIVSLRSAAKPVQRGFVTQTVTDTFRPLRALREGFLSNALNPKTIVFYMAFLPQFIDPARPALPQAITLAAIHFVIAIVWLAFLASMVEKSKAILSKSSVKRVLDSVVGSLMIFFGAMLVWER